MLGKIDGLSLDQIKALANKAKESYGSDVSKWTLAQISEAGNILGKLKKAKRTSSFHLSYLLNM